MNSEYCLCLSYTQEITLNNKQMQNTFTQTVQTNVSGKILDLLKELSNSLQRILYTRPKTYQCGALWANGQEDEPDKEIYLRKEEWREKEEGPVGG